MEFVITRQDAQKVLDYLVTKPFQEVHQLVAIMTSIKELKSNEEAKEAVNCVDASKS